MILVVIIKYYKHYKKDMFLVDNTIKISFVSKKQDNKMFYKIFVWTRRHDAVYLTVEI